VLEHLHLSGNSRQNMVIGCWTFQARRPIETSQLLLLDNVTSTMGVPALHHGSGPAGESVLHSLR
jgi:hypothetical protein